MFYKRIYSLSIAITSIFVYFIWNLTAKIEIQQIQSRALYHIVIWLMDFILAFGFFELVLKFITELLKRFHVVKRFVFGASYVEGIWAGYYENNRKIIYFVEQIEQDLEHTNVSGKGYTEDYSCIGTWKSKSVMINEREGTMECIYESDDHDGNVIKKGTSYFTFNRRDGKSPPHSLRGYSIEIDNAVKIPSKEKKVCRLPNKKFHERELFEMARNMYLENEKEAAARPAGKAAI